MEIIHEHNQLTQVDELAAVDITLIESQRKQPEASLPEPEHTETEKQIAEGLNALFETVNTALDELAKVTDLEKEVLLAKLAKQLGLNKEDSTQAAELIKLATGTDSELFHSPDGTAYATYKNKNVFENAQVESKKYTDYLFNSFYTKFGKPPAALALTSATAYLRAKAIIDSPELPVFVRIAPGENETIYYDLCNKERSVIKITSDGWDIINNPPVKFVRYSGMAEQMMPIKGGNIDKLWKFINITERDRVLLLAWLIQALRPTGPFPVMVMQAGQGAGKSLLARLLRMLIDPSTALLRTLPDNTRDLLITARNSWIQAYDNISTLKDETSDDICRLSTGGGISPRQLYTDTDQIIIDILRPVILNGITAIATRPDLQERSIILQLQIIAKEKRRSEKKILSDFQQAKGEILGALFDMVATAIKNLPNVLDDDLPRMADFFCWVSAAESAMPFAPGAFAKRYIASQDEAVRLQIENDSLATAVCQFMADQTAYEGITTDLLSKLNERVSLETYQAKWWPTVRTLKDRLMRLQGPLLAVGIRYEFMGHEEGGSTHSITKVGKNLSLSSVVSERQSCEPYEDFSICQPDKSIRQDKTGANDSLTEADRPKARSISSKALRRKGADRTERTDRKKSAPSVEDEDDMRGL